MSPLGQHCNLCGAESFTRRYERGAKWLLTCKACNLVTLYPLPEKVELARYYQKGDYFASPYFKVDDEKIGTAHFRHFRKVVELLKTTFGVRAHVLEVGPGRGIFLRMLLDAGLWAEALEFSPPAASQLSQSLPCSVLSGELEEQPFPASTFSAVTAFDVIEHCLNPKQWLESARKVLKPGGLLALSTVNIDNLLDRMGKLFYHTGFRRPFERLYPPYHLYYFTPMTLRRYLEETGFSILSIEQENYDVRKASSRTWERAALRGIYLWHDMTGNKTNLYVVAKKD
jgi:2-polyprenyl-3-methyl-5-hydroxy-6-metoxy-1,4-benzoquinol methylase